MFVVGIPAKNKLGQVTLNISPGELIIIAGPNGVGKSALLYQIYRGLQEGFATFIAGHRQINLNNGIDQINQDPIQLQKNMWQGIDGYNRYKGHWSEDQFKSFLRKLLNKENSFNRNFRQNASLDIENSRSASVQNSPLDTLNLTFLQAGLPVSFLLDSDGHGLMAKRDDARYQVDALSDGERACLFLACAFITQATNTVLLIDEPEKHLHPSIAGIFFDTLLRSRTDIAVILCSHSVDIIEKMGYFSVIHVRNSEITSDRPEMRRYELDMIDGGLLPENLKADVLGSRANILFVEGTEQSRDASLYSHVYPGFRVISKGGAHDVIEAVRGIRSNKSLVWVNAIGLIDRDGRNETEILKLKSRGIMSLPYPTIENIFFDKTLIECFVRADLQVQAGKILESRIREFEKVTMNVAVKNRDEIVARKSSWALTRALGNLNMSAKIIKKGEYGDINISLSDIVESSRNEVDIIISKNSSDELFRNLPIKNTDIPDEASRSLGAKNFRSYCAVIERQIEIGTEWGISARNSLINILPDLADFGQESHSQIAAD